MLAPPRPSPFSAFWDAVVTTDTKMERGRAIAKGVSSVVMRQKRSSPTMMHQAGELRREMTPAEKTLWAALRGSRLCGVSFRRSHAIGRYVPDFCSPGEKLIIELDGEPHRNRQTADSERTAHLEAQGYTVIRFWNSQVVDDLPGVLDAIERAIHSR